MLVADHGRASSALDSRLDLCLNRREGALHDLKDDEIDLDLSGRLSDGHAIPRTWNMSASEQSLSVSVRWSVKFTGRRTRFLQDPASRPSTRHAARWLQPWWRPNSSIGPPRCRLAGGQRPRPLRARSRY